MKDRSPVHLDWGIATTELVNDEESVALHVFNHSLETEAHARRALRFAVARAAWFDRQLPDGFSQWAVFDDRGQDLSPELRSAVREGLSAAVAKVAFMTEGVPQLGAQ